MTEISVDGSRLWSRLMDMAEIGESPNGGSRRLSLTQDDEDGRELFLSWARARGFRYSFDQIGNLFVRRKGHDDTLAPLVIGSHLDTQPNGGRFDGILGVLAGLEVLETLEDRAIETRMPIEAAVWCNEEGARFQPAMMGSGVHCGLHDFEETLATCDENGVTVRQEVERHGYLQGQIPGEHRIAAYLELHIEQGPVLEMAGKTIGVVTGGQAIRWYEVSLEGDETHAGPVPMAMRRDPVPALAGLIDSAYAVAQDDEDARCTIGRLDARPGSINVMPGRVKLSIDLRHPDEAVLQSMDARLHDAVAALQSRYNRLEIQIEQTWHSEVVRFAPALTAMVREGAIARGYGWQELVSGAGHDAFHLAKATPTAMIFVPCRDGVSHNEKEYATPEDVTAGANVLLDVALRYAETQ